jgi:flavorubredoxin
MTIRQIKEEIFEIGSIDWDRRLFDMLIPLPHGTSYNSYLIKGSEKTALIDTVYPAKMSELLSNLENLNVKRLDYIVANHGEQDHSGSIPMVLELYPEAKVLTNLKCKESLISHLDVNEKNIITVDNSSKFSLGNKTLSFIIAPWVHWPDTMFTYLEEDKIIFTCDFMGSHLATSDLYAEKEALVYEPAKRYYAEIMMPFRGHVKKYVEQLRNLDLEIIAPSHGPLYNRPEFILDAYANWASDEIKGEVIVPYVSMYGSTAGLVSRLVDKLIEKGVKVTPFNLPETDLGELCISLVNATTVVFGASMVLSIPHPAAIYAAAIINALRPKLKLYSAIGSYGWAESIGEKMDEQFKALMPAVKAELIKPVFVKGLPQESDLERIDALAEEIFTKQNNLLKQPVS